LTGTPVLAVRRPPWQPVLGDQWIEVTDGAHAIACLGASPRKVFLAVGRQELEPFGQALQHRYVIRVVDPVVPQWLKEATYIYGRGPFTESGDRALLISNSIDAVIAKNSGGTATYSKIAAARALGIPVLLFKRPPAPQIAAVDTARAAVCWLDQVLGLAAPRGV